MHKKKVEEEFDSDFHATCKNWCLLRSSMNKFTFFREDLSVDIRIVDTRVAKWTEKVCRLFGFILCRSLVGIPNCTMRNIFLNPFKLKGLWSFWQFSFWFWTSSLIAIIVAKLPFHRFPSQFWHNVIDEKHHRNWFYTLVETGCEKVMCVCDVPWNIQSEP